MAFKRALWTSGYTYRRKCEYCGIELSYTDRQLDYRSWYPNGFVYCPKCKKPLRHNEIFAVRPDNGEPVYKTQQEANEAIYQGYYAVMGMKPPADPAHTAKAAGDGQVSYCTKCGRPYVNGKDLFCAGCGNKL